MENSRPENFSLQDLEKVSNEFLRCKLDVFSRLADYEKEIEHIVVRVDELEAGHSEFRRTLGRHEEQRITNHTKLTSQVEALHSRFDRHDEQEMQKYDTINSSIIGLTGTVEKLVDKMDKVIVETEANSDYISKTEAEKSKEEYANEKVQEVLAPRQKIKEKIIMTAVTVITAGVLATLWQFIVMGYDLTELVNQAKTVSGK